MKINFTTESEAFEGYNKAGEIARILCKIARQVEEGAESGKVIDVNGNTIGNWEV